MATCGEKNATAFGKLSFSNIQGSDVGLRISRVLSESGKKIPRLLIFRESAEISASMPVLIEIISELSKQKIRVLISSKH